jgi:AbrB family looped-hinge helix DNA binding protein
MTSKGQLTVPKAVREALGLSRGSRVEFIEDPEGGYRIERVHLPVARLAGILRYDGPAKTLKEMDSVIAEAGVAAREPG